VVASDQAARSAVKFARIVGLEVDDVRFPTSRRLDGSDAMNPNPDYSAAYVTVHTDAPDGHRGHGFAFTIGRGNEVQVAAIRALEPFVVGRDVAQTCAAMGPFARELTGDSQLRWLGPEKGVMHMAISAVINALWDLRAKRERQPLWKLLADLSPEELVDLVDFRYLSDALTPGEALAILRGAQAGRAEREAHLRAEGYPAYTTTPGWLGYDEAKLRRLAGEAVADGFTQIKLKVGADLEQDIHRLRIARETIGPDVRLAIDANQRWDVDEAIRWTNALAQYDLHWVEEPTSPDDVLGHAAIARGVAPVGVATGEHVHNRVMFKQLLQLGALSFMQIDACRVGGVNENVALLLLAAKFGVPVCPHAGGVGLCEVVQHLSMLDYVAVSGSLEGRVIEWVDHLHEHFAEPAVVRRGRYRVPERPGAGAEMKHASVAAHRYPSGPVWSATA
jgi:L-fuconate dehydratase